MRGLICTILYAAVISATAQETIQIHLRSPGRLFDGVGGVSAGASTRLLYDYPQPQQEQILDYLFKPGYGAALQVLKVEIGGDLNSTDGAEASHMRNREDYNCGRGYEWWLMREAKLRNPNMVFMALEWGVPGWMTGGFWSDDNINYILKWLDCAAAQGFDIRYIGGWNERKFNPEWYVKMSQAVKARYPHLRVIAADDCRDIWEVASVLRTNADFNAAVDVVGVHSGCGWRTGYEHCPSPEDALLLGKPLWISESSAQGHDLGAVPLSRALNRMYIDGRMTAYLCWPPVCAWYADLPLADTGAILAAWPWSGHYRVGKDVWVFAHTSQFVEPGWQYLDQSCGYLPSGASYVTWRSPSQQDYTLVIETADLSAPEEVRIQVPDELGSKPVSFWQTDLRSNDESRHFIRIGSVTPRSGAVSLKMQPGCVYTLSTTSGQRKGTARPGTDIATTMPLPYRENFEIYRPGQLARYFSDLSGAFETAVCAGRACYQQVTTNPPIAWTPQREMPPTTLAGDPRWWGDYEFGCDVLFSEPGYIELLARVSSQRQNKVAGYHLRLDDAGQWELYSQDTIGDDVTLASGKVPMSIGTWHRVSLRMLRSALSVTVDGMAAGAAVDDRHRTGHIGLRTAPARRAAFDNVAVVPAARAPEVLSRKGMRVAATSEHPASFRGWNYAAENVIDDRPETCWSTEWLPAKPALPQSLTLDLGRKQQTAGLLYRPRLDQADGRILRCRVSLSKDGKDFQPAGEAKWPNSSSAKVICWKPEKVRFIRLEALEGVKGMAAAAEIEVFATAP